jgi:TetR/AcrR family transcriptional repressor of nem operon
MPRSRPTDAKADLLRAGSELIRRNGYVATSVDDVCAAAGVTKGAFFHHFPSKEALAEACLGEWATGTVNMVATAPFQSETDPALRLVGCMDFFVAVFSDPDMLKSCLAGTVVQEVSETHPTLRKAAQTCFALAETRFQQLLDAAFPKGKNRPDTTSLARLWFATLQGSLVLFKASQDATVIRTSLTHVKEYIGSLLPSLPSRRRPGRGKRAG